MPRVIEDTFAVFGGGSCRGATPPVLLATDYRRHRLPTCLRATADRCSARQTGGRLGALAPRRPPPALESLATAPYAVGELIYVG